MPTDRPDLPATADPEVVVSADPEILAAAVAARLLTALVDAQARSGGEASLVLTGGGVGIAVLEQVRDSPARAAVDWSHLSVWWGDERFLPAGDPERNDTQARAALLHAVPLDPARVHPVAGPDEAADPETAAAAYADELGAAVPAFDVLLLGMGPEGHTASLFPHTPYAAETHRSVVGVRDCPKPPPLRVSLTRPAIAAARQVWLCAAGGEKAEAVAAALAGSDPLTLPCAAARGRERSLWLLDAAAASRLP